jgi:pantoate--beta-alanine ligase
MQRLTTIAEVRAASRAARAGGATVGLVPTMGALHEGHLELVRQARASAGFVVVSVFVNPTQFGPGEDLDAYPRDLEADEAALRSLGDDAPDVVFAPAVEEVYPGRRLTTVTVSGLTDVLDGVARPGHFDGVTTVVTKLFHMVEPDLACFGRKDAQQLRIVQQMVRDLDLPVEVVAVPTFREPDGLAMSSRNRYLTAAQRPAALRLSRALRAAVEAAREVRAGGGTPDPGMLREVADVTLRADPEVRPDHVVVLDPDSLTQLAPPPAGEPTSEPGAEAAAGATGGDPVPAPSRLLLAVAAFVGQARLIDNVTIGDVEDEDRLLAATS